MAGSLEHSICRRAVMLVLIEAGFLTAGGIAFVIAIVIGRGVTGSLEVGALLFVLLNAFAVARFIRGRAPKT